MGDLKFAPNLFLEVAELNRFKRFLRDEGYAADLKNNTEEFGIVYNTYFDPNFNYFRPTDIGVPGSVQVQSGFAYDINRKVLTSQGATLTIPLANQWYWLKIIYKTNNIEKGTISIGGSQGGQMNGTGTEFTNILRGEPNFPSKISFLNSVNYQQQYELLSIQDDSTAFVQGSFPIKESNLQYEIVGTFTPGSYPPINDQYPFLYDDFAFEFIPEDALGDIPVYDQGTEFYIARVQQSTTLGLIIQDKRYLFLNKTRSERFFSELPGKANPVIGIENIIRTSLLNKTYYTVNFNWGFRIGQENRNYNLDKVTIISGSGGVYASPNAFTTGDFDGWRYYYQNGDYSRIIMSVKNGTGIDLFLDTLKTEAIGAMICPNAEEIEISLAYSVSSGTNSFQQYKNICQKFYSFTLNPQLVIDQDELDSAYLRVDLLHRFKTIYQLTDYKEFNLALYTVPGLGQVTSQNIILTMASGGNPTSAWRGIDPFCILDTLADPLYYQITTQNPLNLPTVYDPNSTSPSNSVDESTADLYVNFFSDSGRTTPVNVTHVNLRVVVLESVAVVSYPVSSFGGGGGSPTNSVQQVLNVYQVSPSGVSTLKLDTVDTEFDSYIHPTQLPGTRNPVTLRSYTYSEWNDVQLIVGNTGDQGFNNLEQYVIATDLPTGSTKPNLNTDPDYIAPSRNIGACPIDPQTIQVQYFSNLVVNLVSFAGTSSGTKTAPTVPNTENGGYVYQIPPFNQDETVLLTVNINNIGSSNTSGFIWVRVSWIQPGSLSTTTTNVQVPVNVNTQLSQAFTNIQNVNISNF